VAIESLSGKESAVAMHIAQRMHSMGLSASIDEAGNAVGVAIKPGRQPTAPSQDIVLLGHMDTVPGRIPVRIEGDILHGRGSVDAKGPLAAFIVAAATATLPPGVRVVVIGAVEEEAATSRGARHAASAYRPAACILGEPSHWDGVTLGYKGRLVVDLAIKRGSTHSAGPDATPAESAAGWWHAVQEASKALTPGAKGAFDSVQPRLRSFNTTSDGLAETASLNVGFRLPPGVTPLGVEAMCRAIAAERDDCADVVLRCSAPEVAHVVDRASPVARALSNAIRDHGGSPRPRVKTGTSDMNVVGPVWNCPIAAYGPGDSALDHTPGEHISIAEYLRSIQVVRTAIESLAREIALRPAE
ncbi:MAG: [LysW]-lysine hydrolase, partial [Planctomycetota bacterium]